MRGVLVDAGPLIALIDRGDQHHARCVETLKALREPLVSVWPAITEAMYLLGPQWQAQAALWEMLESGAVELAALDEDDVPRRRRSHGEITGICPWTSPTRPWCAWRSGNTCVRVFTLDQRDFRVYRALGLGRLSLLPNLTAASPVRGVPAAREQSGLPVAVLPGERRRRQVHRVAVLPETTRAGVR